ncbi:hypothetical protein ACR0ST_06215 [Aliidiomarina sp. Khilg15.8]
MIKEIIQLEKKGWEALSTDSDSAREFFSSVLHRDAVLLRPGDNRIADVDDILKSITKNPWKGFKMENERAIALSDKVAVFIYRLNAERESGEMYSALVSSTYVEEEGELKLIVNQHTPHSNQK